jgi:hypothetical protein
LHAQDRWAEAVAAFGATGIYTRLNLTAATRHLEQAQLVSAYEPPMNAEEGRPAG